MHIALRAVVAIPVCNEAERLGACLAALARQDLCPDAYAVLLFVNNTTDDSAEMARALAPSLPFRMRIVEDREIRVPNAGWARRVAMDAAAGWLEAEGAPEARHAILTTDADTIVPPDWIGRNLAHLDAGLAAVAGTIALDPDEAEALPDGLKARGVREGRYETLLIELVSRLAPNPHDPWPRHWTASGASLAVDRETYRRVGGMPELPAGEDRAFVAALLSAGAPLRHDPAIRVVTSGRLIGRAIGGAADTMRRRAEHLEAPCDDRLQSVPRVVAGVLWPALTPSVRPLRPAQLPSQIALARVAVVLLRLRDRLSGRATRRAGILVGAEPDPGRPGPALTG